MRPITRRMFLATSSAVGGAVSLLGGGLLSAAPVPSANRKFTMDLVCGAIGVRANQREAIRLARQGGFESVQPSLGELAKLAPAQIDELTAELRKNKLVWGAAGLPVNFRGDESTFRNGLKQLPALSAALKRAGGTRVSTWISPAHKTLTYRQNFQQHATRLREVAKVLKDHGQRFGLEYVGPKTSWSAAKYPFIHTMAEMKELIADIGTGNVGFVLDSWHWYTAGETPADLLTLTNKDVVACDLNDAPAGIAVENQIDNRRELPAATGVIDLAGFLGALVKIGYDGPVRAEPFNQRLRAMDNDAAIAATSAALRKAFALVE